MRYGLVWETSREDLKADDDEFRGRMSSFDAFKK